MAKSPRRPASSPTSTSWLTAAEQRVLDSTVGSSLATATRTQLMAAMKQARSLRDKWRDLFNRQSLATKKGAVRTNDPANTRSLEKSELFGAAVKRVEARIEELAAGIAAVVKGGRGGRPSAAKPVTKSARQAGHRASRASIRETLSEAVAGINAAGRRLLGAAKPTAKPPKPAKPAVVAAASAAAGKPLARTAKPAQTGSKKARQAGKLRSLAAAGKGQAIHFDPKQQRSAKARATVSRIKLDGLSTRRRGHTLAAGKRKQARRDGR